MATISTHVLDTSRGEPAEGVRVSLAALSGGSTLEGRTGTDGRLRFEEEVALGLYALRFELGERYPSAAHIFQAVELVLKLDQERHYHVPLLLSPFGVTSYRGS